MDLLILTSLCDNSQQILSKSECGDKRVIAWFSSENDKELYLFRVFVRGEVTTSCKTVKIVYSDAFQPQLSVFSTSLPAVVVSVWPVDGEKWYLPLSFLHTGMHPCPPEQSSPCWEWKTLKNHNSSYFLSGLFLPLFSSSSTTTSSVASFLCHFTVDITELCGDKEAGKNNNRPIDPHFTNLGGRREIHLQGWNRAADRASMGFLLEKSGSAAQGPDSCSFLSEHASAADADLHPSCVRRARHSCWSVDHFYTFRTHWTMQRIHDVLRALLLETGKMKNQRLTNYYIKNSFQKTPAPVRRNNRFFYFSADSAVTTN